MFVTDFQFEYFLDCLFIGLSAGLFYLPVLFVKKIAGRKI